jgi:hypothetical protein
MSVDETMGQGGQLTIEGIFGKDRDSVTVGGPNSDPTIESWGTNKIVVDLNLSGLGSAGDVQVTVRGHQSNVARLTDWWGSQFTFTVMDLDSLKQKTVYNLHFRDDVREWRKEIHQPPIEPSGLVASANDSTSTFLSSGSSTQIATTFIWKGSGTLSNVLMPGGWAIISLALQATSITALK